MGVVPSHLSRGTNENNEKPPGLRCPGWDSNRVTPEHKSGTLPPHHRARLLRQEILCEEMKTNYGRRVDPAHGIQCRLFPEAVAEREIRE
jgi:hypothetical protein